MLCARRKQHIDQDADEERTETCKVVRGLLDLLREGQNRSVLFGQFCPLFVFGGNAILIKTKQDLRLSIHAF